ncbi:MAG TPA: hypothetical protein VJ826_02865 [Candidatus Polarisedimenticolaceae bacterium]|nr:hypothetical protein [Candidatus Polarisedimenticolaceae bacterium]
MDKVIAFTVIAILIALPIWAVIAGLKGKRKSPQGQAASLVQAGLMEAQNLLEPERKIEVVREEERKRDVLEAPSPFPGSPPGPLPPPPPGSSSKKA